MKQQPEISTTAKESKSNKDAKLAADELISALQLTVKEATLEQLEEINPLMECYN